MAISAPAAMARALRLTMACCNKRPLPAELVESAGHGSRLNAANDRSRALLQRLGFVPVEAPAMAPWVPQPDEVTMHLPLPCSRELRRSREPIRQTMFATSSAWPPPPAPDGELLFRLPTQAAGVAVFTLGERQFDWYAQ